MKISALFPVVVFGFLVLAPIAHARIDRTVEKAFTVQAGGLLTVETEGGNVRVAPGDATSTTVKVVAHQRFPKAGTEAEADEALKGFTFTIEQAGNDVTAVARFEKKSGFTWSWGNRPVQVDFVVTVPAKFNVRLSTSGGDVALGDLSGEARLRTSGGDIKIGRIDGPVDASTSGGDVTLAGCTGAVVLKTSGGDIESGAVGGRAELATSGGDIKISEAAGPLSARTSGGDITVRLTTVKFEDTNLSTSGGRVKVEVPAAAGFQLDASTSGGDVEAAGLTIKIEKGGVGKSRLAGAVNGGGALLRARSSGGDIVVIPR